MADILDKHSGENGPGKVRFHDENDGTLSEAVASHLRGWDSTDGAWYRLPVNHVTGALKVDATLSAGSVDIGIVDQGNAGASAWPVSVAALTDGTARIGGTVAVTQSTSPWVTNDPGLPDTLGQKNMAGSTSVALASDQASIPVAATLAAETTKVIGTINVASGQTIGLAAGVAEIGNVKNSGTFAVQAAATLAAETTKVIGTVNIAAGQTVGLAAGSQVIGSISNTAFQANAGTNLNTSLLALDSTLTGGTQLAQAMGIYNSTPPSPVSGTQTQLQLDSRGQLRVGLWDAAGANKAATVAAPGDGSSGQAALATFNQLFGLNSGNSFDRLRANNNDGLSTGVLNVMTGVYNGTTIDRLRGDTTNGAYVNVKTSVLPTGAALELGGQLQQLNEFMQQVLIETRISAQILADGLNVSYDIPSMRNDPAYLN